MLKYQINILVVFKVFSQYCINFTPVCCHVCSVWKSTTLKTALYIVTNNQDHPHFSPQISAYLIDIFSFYKWSLLYL